MIISKESKVSQIINVANGDGLEIIQKNVMKLWKLGTLCLTITPNLIEKIRSNDYLLFMEL